MYFYSVNPDKYGIRIKLNATDWHKLQLKNLSIKSIDFFK